MTKPKYHKHSKVHLVKANKALGVVGSTISSRKPIIIEKFILVLSVPT